MVITEPTIRPRSAVSAATPAPHQRPARGRGRTRTGLVIAVLAAALTACGSGGTPQLSVGTVQAAEPVAGSSQIVLSITNTGDGDDALTGVATDAAVGIELHETRIEDQRATMVALDEVPLPAGTTVRFRPGGLHLMMIGPADEVEVGSTFEVTLEFDRSAPITTTAEVRDLLDLAEESFDEELDP